MRGSGGGGRGRYGARVAESTLASNVPGDSSGRIAARESTRGGCARGARDAGAKLGRRSRFGPGDAVWGRGAVGRRCVARHGERSARHLNAFERLWSRQSALPIPFATRGPEGGGSRRRSRPRPGRVPRGPRVRRPLPARGVVFPARARRFAARLSRLAWKELCERSLGLPVRRARSVALRAMESTGEGEGRRPGRTGSESAGRGGEGGGQVQGWVGPRRDERGSGGGGGGGVEAGRGGREGGSCRSGTGRRRGRELRRQEGEEEGGGRREWEGRGRREEWARRQETRADGAERGFGDGGAPLCELPPPLSSPFARAAGRRCARGGRR